MLLLLRCACSMRCVFCSPLLPTFSFYLLSHLAMPQNEIRVQCKSNRGSFPIHLFLNVCRAFCFFFRFLLLPLRRSCTHLRDLFFCRLFILCYFNKSTRAYKREQCDFSFGWCFGIFLRFFIYRLVFDALSLARTTERAAVIYEHILIKIFILILNCLSNER